jgi:hypothetical protein
MGRPQGGAWERCGDLPNRTLFVIMRITTGRGAAWLARYNGVVEVPGSNPGAPTEEAATWLPFFVGILAKYGVLC